MSKIKLTLPGTEIPVTGKQVTFNAPCDCSVVDCIQIDGVDYDVVDSLGHVVTGRTGTWAAGAQVSVILDVENKKAYLQNISVYNRAEALADETKALYGFDDTAAPDDVFRYVREWCPQIVVSAPAGSTINLLQSGVIVATYTLEDGETDHSFAVKFGTYTAQATLGEQQSRSVEVKVDAVCRYEIALNYPVYIVKDGVLLDGFTFTEDISNRNSGCKGEVGYDPLYLYHYYQYYTLVTLTTALNLNGFATVNATLSAYTTGDANYGSTFQVGVASAVGGTLTGSTLSLTADLSMPTTLSFPLENLDSEDAQGHPYLKFIAGGSETNGRVTIKDFWIE